MMINCSITPIRSDTRANETRFVPGGLLSGWHQGVRSCQTLVAMFSDFICNTSERSAQRIELTVSQLAHDSRRLGSRSVYINNNFAVHQARRLQRAKLPT